VQSDDATVLAPVPVPEPFLCGDARHMDQVAEGSVALVVTSPPYFAGKQYERSSTVRACRARTSSTSSSCETSSPNAPPSSSPAAAWRSTSPISDASPTAACPPTSWPSSRTNCACCHAARSSGARARAPAGRAPGLISQRVEPVLRDVTERVLVVSKGRFDRARSVRDREARASRTATRSRAMSSWPPPSTSGRCSPNGHGAWSTRPHSPSSSPSGSSGSTPTRTTSSSTRSWARAQRSWPPAASSAAMSATTSTRPTSPSPVLGWPLRGRHPSTVERRSRRRHRHVGDRWPTTRPSSSGRAGMARPPRYSPQSS